MAARHTYPSPSVDKMRAGIVDEIARELGRRTQTREQLSGLLRCGIREVTDLRCRRAEAFTSERLIRIAERLGLRVHVAVTVERMAA